MGAAAPSYGLTVSDDEFEKICQRIAADGRPFGYDIETSYDGDPREGAPLHPEENFICGLSLTNSLAWARYAPLRHDAGPNLDNQRAAAAFWGLAQTGLGVAHGAKFELRCLSRWFMAHLSDHPLLGAPVRASDGYYPVRSCTMLESYVEAKHRFHGLKDIVQIDFGHQMTRIMDLFPPLTSKQQKMIRFSELGQQDPKVYSYACEDSLWALAEHLRCYPLVRGSFIYQLEMAVLPVVCAMEDTGVWYDWNFMREASARGKVFLDRLQGEIGNDLTALVRERTPGAPAVRINLGSPAQLGKVLYEDLGLRTRRRTDSGKPSTDKIALKGLASDHPVVRKILNWKSLRKLTGTYLDVYEGRFSYADDGLTHPNHMQHGVPAGRFAVDGPPYQQSPKKYHFTLDTMDLAFDFNFRCAIGAPRGWYQLGFDLSQAELRALAGEAGETALIEAFAAGEDVHAKTAALMLGKELADVTKEDRDVGKTLNFAMSYQMGVDGLADRLGITKDAAQDLFDQYFAVYSKIKAYMDRVVAGARATGCVTTHFGRQVRIWDLDSEYRHVRAAAERTAGNVPIQGAATGDYMKIAMVRSHRALKAAGLLDRVRLSMNIHDALEWYVRDDVPVDEVVRVLQPAVIFPVDGWPAMRADWHAGRRWGSVREIELLPDGSVRAKDAGEPEPRAAELDGDADEEDGLSVDAEAVRQVLQREPARGPQPAPAAAMALPEAEPDTAPRRVIISIEEMPQREAFGRLMAALASRPGQNEAVLRTPAGDFPLGSSAVTPAWQPQVSMILGSVLVTYDLDSVDCSSLAAGLEL